VGHRVRHCELVETLQGTACFAALAQQTTAWAVHPWNPGPSGLRKSLLPSMVLSAVARYTVLVAWCSGEAARSKQQQSHRAEEARSYFYQGPEAAAAGSASRAQEVNPQLLPVERKHRAEAVAGHSPLTQAAAAAAVQIRAQLAVEALEVVVVAVAAVALVAVETAGARAGASAVAVDGASGLRTLAAAVACAAGAVAAPAAVAPRPLGLRCTPPAPRFRSLPALLSRRRPARSRARAAASRTKGCCCCCCYPARHHRRQGCSVAHSRSEMTSAVGRGCSLTGKQRSAGPPLR